MFSSIFLGISLAAPIGPVSIEMIKRGLSRGFFAAFPVSMGAATGDALYLLLTYFGLAPFLVNPIVRSSILFFGSVVLIYLGIQSILDAIKGKAKLPTVLENEKNAFIMGFTLAVVNPMTVVWWLGVFGLSLGQMPVECLTWTCLCNHSFIILGVLLWGAFFCGLLHLGQSFVTERILQIISGVAGACLFLYGASFLSEAVMDILSVF